MPDIRIAAGGPAPQLLLHDAQGERPLPALWLRARSPDPLERDVTTQLVAVKPMIELDPGQLMMFDNNRVLHGRTSFDPSEGHRQLQGCYIDRDGPRSLYRVLKRRPATH